MTHPLSYLPPHRARSGLKGEDSLDTGHYRDQTVISFEWHIRGVKWLKEHVEGQAGGLWTIEAEMNDPEGLPEALRRGVVIGEGCYKLDIGKRLRSLFTPELISFSPNDPTWLFTQLHYRRDGTKSRST
jgi:hypothetical protein